LNVFQIDIDFWFPHSTAVNLFVNDFPKWAGAILSTARLSRKTDIVDLFRVHDAVEHSTDGTDLEERDIMYAILALLKRLPSANT
jgi:hypothetical protein